METLNADGRGGRDLKPPLLPKFMRAVHPKPAARTGFICDSAAPRA